jgi:hypothetical protein|tara:strand:+ start:3098 stop:3322 length:225 start_codon:yes stop_codon:yes gene_type:complete
METLSVEDKLYLMFHVIHGKMGRSCSVEIAYKHDEYEFKAIGINVMKDGYIAWSVSKEDLLFDYLTRDSNPENW